MPLARCAGILYLAKCSGQNRKVGACQVSVDKLYLAAGASEKEAARFISSAHQEGASLGFRGPPHDLVDGQYAAISLPDEAALTARSRTEQALRGLCAGVSCTSMKSGGFVAKGISPGDVWRIDGRLVFVGALPVSVSVKAFDT